MKHHPDKVIKSKTKTFLYDTDYVIPAWMYFFILDPHLMRKIGRGPVFFRVFWLVFYFIKGVNN